MVPLAVRFTRLSNVPDTFSVPLLFENELLFVSVPPLMMFIVVELLSVPLFVSVPYMLDCVPDAPAETDSVEPEFMVIVFDRAM